MGTTHEQAAHALLDRLLRDEGSAEALTRIRRRLGTPGFYTPQFVNAVGQVFRRDSARWPPHQAACFLMIHHRVLTGKVAEVTVEVGQEPGPDADRTGNAAALADLPEPFEASLDLEQYGADEDGLLLWERPITVTRCTGTFFYTDCGSVPVTRPNRLPDAQVPLEVGYTLPSRAWSHLLLDGGVARWPYGSRHLHLLLNTAHPALRGAD
ncbi:hypothetical protein ACIG3E_23480 [Streptomyces sp. NPDC053474]|uniref:hypothetical protein n=1 Tax=Streptomyces sp. NPDC053474 TaxID=3365704 RepID=UPI0037CF9078